MLRCIAGRWGGVASTEEKLLGAKGCVATVFFQQALGAVTEIEDDPGAVGGGPDEERLQAQVAYRMARGRCAREVLAAQADYLLMTVVELQHTAKGTITALLEDDADLAQRG